MRWVAARNHATRYAYRMNRLLLLVVASSLGCNLFPETSVDQRPAADLAGQSGRIDWLPVKHAPDPSRAAAGEAHFSDGTFARALIPLTALRSLFYVWGGVPPSGDDAYWAAFRERYGFFEAPYANDGLPMGLRKVDATSATFDCRMCHADVVAGQARIGAGNSRLDYQGLMDELQTLANLAATVGFPSYQNIVAGQKRTAAAGATDAMGLGFWLSTNYALPPAELQTNLGFQQPAPWWNLRYKDRIYSDNSGSVEGNRTMMSMYLSFGMTLAEIQKLDEPMEDLRHYLLSLPPPIWPFVAPAGEAEQRGRAVFGDRCASCHGTYGGSDANYPGLVVNRSAVGTDPVRAERLTSVEADWVNASWFGEKHPMKATGGYIAPPLAAVWASAPYFHNGSVPDLRSVLRSSERPVRWRRAGSSEADYDPDRVGWRYTTPQTASVTSIEGRKTYDTTQLGLSNAGHTYGDGLSDADLGDLLDYLKTL